MSEIFDSVITVEFKEAKSETVSSSVPRVVKLPPSANVLRTGGWILSKT